jgi:hypothetical protein
MPAQDLTQAALDLAQRAIDQPTKLHRAELLKELAALRARQRELPEPSPVGASGFWKRYRETQPFQVTDNATGLSETILDLQKVAERWRISVGTLKRKLDLNRGECLVWAVVPNDHAHLTPGDRVEVTITRLPHA